MHSPPVLAHRATPAAQQLVAAHQPGVSRPPTHNLPHPPVLTTLPPPAAITPLQHLELGVRHLHLELRVQRRRRDHGLIVRLLRACTMLLRLELGMRRRLVPVWELCRRRELTGMEMAEMMMGRDMLMMTER